MIRHQVTKLITDKEARVGVIGLGYVGLPLVVEYAASGFEGIGFEVDETKANKINQGDSYIGDVPASRVKELVSQKKLSATTDFDRLADCQIGHTASFC